MISFKRVGVIAAVLLCAGAIAVWADTRPNPYLSIADRNPFVLKPIPPEVPPQEPTPPPIPLAKVVLTGVTSIFGPPRALLEITEQEPGKQPTVNKRILREGERDGSVEVLSIDVVHTSVRIKNGTVETNVIFEVAKSSPGPTGPTGPTGAMPPPISLPSISPPAAPPSFTSVPTAPAAATPLNIGGDGRERANTGVSFAGGTDLNPSAAANPFAPRGGVGTPYAQNVNVNPLSGGVSTYGAGAGSSVSRPLRTATGGPAGPTLTAREADIIFEIEREKFRQTRAAGGDAPPLPPTQYTRALQGEATH